MSTIEKLIVQIFERKNSIIEQVRHQVELYDQQLASKLVIQGIEPPSWLWNHQPPSQSAEIDKQRLISELLLPHPQQAVPYFNNFNCNSITIRACNFDQLDESLGTTCFDGVGYVPHISSELEPAASSPQQQIATKLEDINGELDSSLAEFKRSKSRQRALELRSSAKSGLKRHSLEESAIFTRDSAHCKDDVLRCNHVEKPESDECLDIHHYDDCVSEGIKIRSSNDNNSGGSLPIQLFNHGDHVCKRDSFGTESSEQINKSTQSPDILCIQREGYVEFEGINIGCCKGNDTNVCVSVDRICKSKSVGAVYSGKMNKSTQFQGTSNIHHGDAEPEGINIQCSKENSTIEAMPSQQFKHECDSVELVCCTSETIGAVSSWHMDDNVLESLEMVSTSAVAYGNSSTDAAVNLNDLSNARGKVHSPSRIIRSDNSCNKLSDEVPALHTASIDGEIGFASSSDSLHYPTHDLELPVLVRPFGISDKSSGLKQERPKDHSSNEKAIGNFSGRPLKSESSIQIYSELALIFPAEEKVGNISGASSSYKPLLNHDHVIESLQRVTTSGLSAGKENGSTEFSGEKNRSKSSGVTFLEPQLSSSHPEGSNNLLEVEYLEALITEAEVPLLKSATVEQPYLQMEEASSSLKVEQLDLKNMIDGYAMNQLSSSKEHCWRIFREKHGTFVEPTTISFLPTSFNMSREGSWPQLKHKRSANQNKLCSSAPSGMRVNTSNALIATSSVDLDNTAACEYSLFKDDVYDQVHGFRVQSLCSQVTSEVLEDSSNMKAAEDNIGLEKMEKTEVAASLAKETNLSFSTTTLGKGETEDSLRYSIEEAEEPTDDSIMIEKQSECLLDSSHLFLDMEGKLNEEHPKHENISNKSSLEREPCIAGVGENGLVDDIYIDMMDNDQTMPVLEGFVMDTCDGESHFAGGEIGFEEPCLPNFTSSQASILEQLCHSASRRNTPISHFPMTYRLHKTSDLYQSVPNGLLEHMPVVNDYSNKKFEQKSHSAGLPVSTDPFNINLSTPYASPVKKKWDRNTLSSGLRGQWSLNSDLCCFTIEEDPGNCDEIENRNDTAEALPNHPSCLKISSKRKPLSDITEDVQNPRLSVSANDKFCFKSHRDYGGMEANFTGAQSQVKQIAGEKFSNKKRRLNDAKETSKFSVGASGGNRVTDSQKESKSQKLKGSENPNITMGVICQQKVLRSNNIVSNISSFIPPVQQKKAVAIVKGKRDVKVKALEAAEAAKRLEKKKENERKMKKEAWKAEKARLEQENLLQLELKKKKKEEEQKKKEAEMAARKRVREEEEKKEKELKRRRIEEARKQQHEQEKKQGGDKLKKEIRHQAAGVKVLEKKNSSTELEQCKEMDIGGDKCRLTTDFEDKSMKLFSEPKTMLCDLKGCNTLAKASLSVGGDVSLNMVMSDLNATTERKFKVKAEGQQSYEISPYQGSDDEDDDEDDEDDRRKEKFVPAWASKNNLAEAIFSQQHMNPDEILVLGSFCSIAEVLVPRKQQEK